MNKIEKSNEVCNKIKQLSTELDRSDLIKTIASINLPLGLHLAIMSNFDFICKNGRIPTKKDLKIQSLL